MQSSTFRIADRALGPGEPCFVIAEIAQAHDGSLGMAHAYIDAIADAGADAVKFQTHIAEAESTPAEPWRVKFSPQDETRYQYWQRMEFTREQWKGLKEHADRRGLTFLSSPFSPEAVDLLTELGVPAWKVASGEVFNTPMIERMLRRHPRPMLLSSGMSDFPELDRAVAQCRDAGAPVAVFQCTTAYPCPPESIGLNLLAELRRRYDCPVGLSDHSGKVFAGLAAVALGANLVEVHVTFSRQMFGPDVPASLTFEELAQLTGGVREIGRMLRAPVAKQDLAAQTASLRRVFGKSVVAAEDLAAGTVLTEENLRLKKPGTGIPAAEWRQLIGRRLVRPVAKDAQLAHSDLVANSQPEPENQDRDA